MKRHGAADQGPRLQIGAVRGFPSEDIVIGSDAPMRELDLVGQITMDFDVQVRDFGEHSKALARRTGDRVAIAIAVVDAAVIAAAAEEFGD